MLEKSCPFPRSAPQIERVFAASQIFFEGVGYCSLSEAALGALLEVFIPGFKIREGETYQVPIGEGRSVDFLVNGVLIEYHQPRLNPEQGKTGDYQSREQYQKFLRESRRLGNNSFRRERLVESTLKILSENYYQRRRELVDRGALRGTELIVAHSREDFYNKIILRFVSEDPPSLGEFIARFWWWVNIIARQNGLPALKKP